MDYTQFFILACIFIPLERLLPLHREQGTFRRDWANDLFYVIFNGFVIRFGFTTIAGVVMVAYSWTFGANPFPWIGQLPLWLQVVAVIVVADIGYYIAHRISHAVPVLWKFHEVHHSIEQMDWIAAHRVHPVDQVFTSLFSMLPLFFLGFTLEALLIRSAIYYAQVLLIHSNVRVRFGPLKWLIASPEYHHWHHANEPEAYDRNFAAQLSIIDYLAGTIFLPDRQPKAYGLNDPVPKLYHEQLVHPFRGIARMVRNRATNRNETPDEQDA